MTQLESLRSRYLRDPIPIRLGGLAANLARVARFSTHEGHREAVSATLQESKWFIEWIAAELEESEKTAELVQLQIQLALWQIQANNKWNDNHWRSQLETQSEQWSQRILQMSGLLS